MSILPKTLEGLHLADAREFAERIPDESVDLIMCDPIYERVEDYLWLAQTAERVLKPDRALLAFCSDIKMFDIKILMDSVCGLSFIKPFYYVVEAKGSCLRGYGLYTWTTPALLYVKGKGWPGRGVTKKKGVKQKRCPDTKIEQASTFVSRDRPKGKFKWNKNPEVLGSWVTAFTEPDEVVFDPYTGSGSVPYICAQLKRRYIACEISPETYNLAAERLSAVQQQLTLETLQGSIFNG